MRRFIRHPSDMPIQIRKRRAAAEMSARMRNLSHGGLCFCCTPRLPPGTRVQIAIPVQQPPFTATGVVVWCRRTNGRHDVGVSFADESVQFAVRMVEQVCHIEHYRREVQRSEGRALSSEEAAAEWISRHAREFPH